MVWTGSPEQKKAWAIKKAQERSKSPGARTTPARSPIRALVPGYQISPQDHRCNPHDIKLRSTYTLQCTKCGRSWTARVQGIGADGSEIRRYVVTPLTEKMPPPSR